MKRSMFLIVVLSIVGACSPKEIKWVAIGDSITYLNDHLEETGNRVTKGYMTRVVEKSPQLKYVNKGYNGWTSHDIAKEVDSLDLDRADMYSVFLSTNDWWQGRPIGTIEDYKNDSGNGTLFGSYRIIIKKLQKLNKNSRIILITPMQRGDFVYLSDMKNNAHGSYRNKNGQTLAQFAEAIATIGRYEKLEVIDLYSNSSLTLANMVKFKRLKNPVTGSYENYPYPDFIDVPFNPDTDEYPYPPDAVDMTYDGLHPSDKGYEVIAGMILEVIKK